MTIQNDRLGPAAAHTTRRRAAPRTAPGQVPLQLRVQVWWRMVELDRALAGGRDPAGSAHLELRAQQLASERVRWHLASTLRTLVTQAEAPLALGSFTAASAVRRAGGVLLELADALTDPACTNVRGVARAACLICDGANSPLYERGSPEALRRVAYEALAMLRGAA